MDRSEWREEEMQRKAETNTQWEHLIFGQSHASSLSQTYTLANILLLKMGLCHLEPRILTNTRSMRSYM